MLVLWLQQSLFFPVSASPLWAGGTFWSPQPRLVAAKSCSQGTATVAETLLSSPWGQCADRDDQRCYSDGRSSPVAGCSPVPSTLCCSLEALHTASPHSHQVQPWVEPEELGLVNDVPFWDAPSTTPKETNPGVHKNQRTPQPLLVPYDERLMLQQIAVKFLYLTLEFQWLHPSSRCCVLICCLLLQADAGQTPGGRLLWASGHGWSGGDWQGPAKGGSDRGSEDVER